VLDLCEQAGAISLAVICLPELISTLCRLVREGKLTSPCSAIQESPASAGDISGLSDPGFRFAASGLRLLNPFYFNSLSERPASHFDL
jgi:hypothetical protein